jgi:hypothetical protein
MPSYLSSLRILGVFLVFGTFGLTLFSAILAGVDPIWAAVRAIGCSIILLFVYFTLYRIFLPLLKIDEHHGKKASHETHQDSNTDAR